MSKFSFLTEWREPSVDLIKKLLLNIYTEDSSVELIDVVQRKPFLKRTNIELPQNIQIGKEVSILGRKLNITDFADEFTRQEWGRKMEKIFLAISEADFRASLSLIKELFKRGCSLTSFRMAELSQNGLDSWRNLKQPAMYLKENSIVHVMVWQGANVADIVRENISTYKALSAIHFEADPFVVSLQRDFFFDLDSVQRFPQTALLKNTTLAIIKPHVLRSASENQGAAADIIESILSAGFAITDMNLVTLDQTHSMEFLEVYKTVLPDFKLMADELASGPCIAMEIACSPPVVETFRQWCGPYDPLMAQKIRPDSIRAKYGIDIARNALHCTDLEEDGELETRYFFKILTM